MTTEIERIQDQLRLTLEGDAWHGPAVLQLLDGVTSDQAAAHPIPGAHSIWELVLHLGSTYDVVLRRMRGEEAQLTPEEDWPSVPAISAANWEAAVERLRKLNREVRETVSSFDPAKLDRALVGVVTYTAYTQLIGLTQHDTYHGGQIALLKRAMGAR